MGVSKLHIGIIEPSWIVYEGIVTIILQSGVHYHISKIDTFTNLEVEHATHSFDVILCNSEFIKNENSIFKNFKNIYPNVPFFGIVYTFIDKKILEQFDTIIQISDTPHEIISLLENLSNEESTISTVRNKDVLSEREIQVLQQLVHGLSNKEIADKLYISTHTVISHRKNIIQKTGIKSQSGLTIYALSNKIISL